MIQIATALMYTGFVVGVMGMLSLLILLYRAARDAAEARRSRQQEEIVCACPRCREARFRAPQLPDPKPETLRSSP